MSREDWAPTFLAELAKSPNVSAAARAAGIGRKAAYAYRNADPDFASDWDDALEQSTDSLVGEAYRRAHEGTERPVYYKGAECGTVREYSDSLAVFLLKAHRREVYGDTSKVQAEHTGPGGGPINVTIYVPDNGRDPRDG
jgi:hypothetical protein